MCLLLNGLCITWYVGPCEAGYSVLSAVKLCRQNFLHIQRTKWVKKVVWQILFPSQASWPWVRRIRKLFVRLATMLKRLYISRKHVCKAPQFRRLRVYSETEDFNGVSFYRRCVCFLSFRGLRPVMQAGVTCAKAAEWLFHQRHVWNINRTMKKGAFTHKSQHSLKQSEREPEGWAMCANIRAVRWFH